MSIRKRKRTRDVAVRMGPGEFIDPHDLPRIIPWKRVLDIATEELPDFLPSLVKVPDGKGAEEHVLQWLEDWHLPADGTAARIARDTLAHRALCNEQGIPHEQGLYTHPLDHRPPHLSKSTWMLGDVEHIAVNDAYGTDVGRMLQDTEGTSILYWNPFHETRADATERLRGYLDMALDQIERAHERFGYPDGRLYGRMRTPELPRRHIAWFVRWKFNDESIYGIAKAGRVSENAVRKAIDNVADVLGWGYRNGNTG